MKVFQDKKTTLSTQITLEGLSSLITECNSYLMVLAWLHRLATIE